MKKDIKTIGINQNISLPGYYDHKILAKVDTGAYRSSIWASSINEKDGVLSFVLFAPKSAYYTGEEIKTDKYTVALIKNSFGKVECRYTIDLPVKVDDEVFESSFSLANRSNNRFPALLGRQFLRHRFVVDVSKREKRHDKKGLAVVLVTGVTEPIKKFFDEVAKKTFAEVLLCSYGKLTYRIDENGKSSILLPDGRDISKAGVVYFKSHSLYPEQALAVAKYLEHMHVPFFDAEVGSSVSRSKFSELFILSNAGISVPKSEFCKISKIPAYSDICKEFGRKFVLKDVFSDRGKNNYLIIDKASFDEAVQRLINSNVKIVLIQKYIENEGFLRVLVMGGRIIQVVKRMPSEHKNPLKNHLNKPRGGVNAIELAESDLSAEIISLVHKGSMALNRNIAGIDLIQDIITKKWYVLEVNYNPEFVSGFDPSKKAKGLAKFIEERIA